MHSVLVNDTNKRAFLSECVQSSRILHPNVVQFLGIYYPSPRARLPWLVMELMYISLRGLIEKYEKDDIPFHFTLSILMDTCHGLQFLHSQNVIHRDLSSNNILLTKHLVAKISDLGMAKVIPPGLQKHTQAPGTVVFMPPEALSVNPQYGKPIDDIFSVGCVCVHVISMQWPTPSDQVVNNVVLSEVQRRERYFTKMIPSLQQLVKQCLQDKPEQRPVIEEVTRGLRNINYDHQPHKDDNIIDLFTSALKCSSQERMADMQKDQQLISKDKQLVEKDEQLSKKDQVIVQKDQQLFQKDQMLHQKDQLIKEKDQEIIEKEQRLNQKDQIIVQKDQQLYQKDQIICEKDQLIKLKDQEIIQEKERQITKPKSLTPEVTATDDFSKIAVQKGSDHEFPPSWEDMPRDSSGKEIVCHVVDLQPSDPEYTEVHTAFTSTILLQTVAFGLSVVKRTDIEVEVVKIQRIQNPALYAQYAGRKKIMEKENPNIRIERWLFHECLNKSFVKQIYHQGFNRSIGGPNSSEYGGGVGFAVNAGNSNSVSRSAYIYQTNSSQDVNGNQVMFYARVLTGEYTTPYRQSDKQRLKAPPHKDNSILVYDSVVDSVDNPRQYVVFNNDQSYPDYLITYKVIRK